MSNQNPASTQHFIDSNQIAFNTLAERHSTSCPRTLRAAGELFRPGKSTHLCNCWVIGAASEIISSMEMSGIILPEPTTLVYSVEG